MEKVLQRVEMCLTMCKEQILLTKETEEWTKCQVLQKRRPCEESLNSIFWVPSKRTNQRRPVVQCLQKELNKPSFLDGHGNYDSSSVSFKLKSL